MDLNSITVKLSEERQKALNTEKDRYFLQSLMTIDALSASDILDILPYFRYPDRPDRFNAVYEKFFAGKVWTWPELEKWRQHGFKTGEWISCLCYYIFRHDFNKDDVSDFFVCVNRYYAKKQLMAAGQFYPKRHIEKAILERANEDEEYRKFLHKIMRELYQEMTYRILFYTSEGRADNAWKKKEFDSRMNTSLEIKYFFKPIIASDTDRIITERLAKENPDAMYPLIPCENFGWQIMMNR